MRWVGRAVRFQGRSAWNYLPDGSETHHFKTVYSIARDNDGRVSVKLAPSSGTPMAFSTDVWDPIEGTKTSFRSCVQDAKDATSSNGCAVEKLAKVWAAPRRNPDSGLPVFPDPFKPLPAHHLSDLVPRSGELVDLGEKSIEGTKVRGYRNVGTTPHVTFRVRGTDEVTPSSSLCVVSSSVPSPPQLFLVIPRLTTPAKNVWRKVNPPELSRR
jgi:hypothetical protein